MATTNPVLARSETFRPNAGYPQGFQPDAYYNPQSGGYETPQSFQAIPQPGAGRMTIDDVILKTSMLLLGVIAAGGLTMFLLPTWLIAPVALISGLVSFLTVMFVSTRRVLPVAGLFVYALVEGAFIGAFSLIFELRYPGIVISAVVATGITAMVVMACYKFLGVRVNGRIGKIVAVSIIAYAVVALLNLVLTLFGHGLGLGAIGADAGPMAWLFSGVGVVLAAASLISDFEVVENGVRNQAPESESWRAAFGLTVTMLWMYTNLLRILSYFRR